ncbi:MAG: hypothetical protein HOP17_17945 [Acidobacteria bacterium]|nr:hypothetical protein [Acidobacteriota bacterium]
MNSTKCRKCGLTNFATDLECARCGTSFVQITVKSGPRPKFSIAALIIFLSVAAVFYYIFIGVQGSVDKVNSTEANRVGAQPLPPDAGRSRAEYDRYRSQTVANAVGAAPGLAEHTNRTQQTDKAIDQMTNSQPQ